jgi:peptidoglycan hydrolase-like protein with peptidoglycan-binding domain
MKTYVLRSTIIGLLVVGLFAVLPATVFAQDAAVSATTSTQVQSLMDQIKGLQDQLKALLHVNGPMIPVGATSTRPLPPPGICHPIARALGLGMRGQDIKDFQDTLISDGFLSGTSTGYFGAMTRDAVKQFQTQNGVGASTGTVGPLTRDVFNKRCGQGGQGGSATSTTGFILPPGGPDAHIFNGTNTPPFPPIPGTPGHRIDGPMGSTTPPGAGAQGGLDGMIGKAISAFMPMLGNNFANGSITAVGSNTITVQNAGGTAKTVFVTSGTQVRIANATSTPMISDTTFSALVVGQRVAVTGTLNADGTVTATTVTIVNGVQNW